MRALLLAICLAGAAALAGETPYIVKNGMVGRNLGEVENYMERPGPVLLQARKDYPDSPVVAILLSCHPSPVESERRLYTWLPEHNALVVTISCKLRRIPEASYEFRVWRGLNEAQILDALASKVGARGPTVWWGPRASQEAAKAALADAWPYPLTPAWP